MPKGSTQQMSDGMRTLLLEGSPLYLKTAAALRHFNSATYDECHAVLSHNAMKFGDSIGVPELGSRKIRPHVYPGSDVSSDWDGLEAYIGAKIQVAPYMPLILYFYLGNKKDDEELAWSTGISLGFTSYARMTSAVKQLETKKGSLASESSGSYKTDSWLLDFSLTKPLDKVDAFPKTLEDVVELWLENCRAVGGLKLVI